MKMLQTRVRQEANVKTVWANAWRYEGKDEMQSALVHAILAVVKEDRTLTNEVSEILERIKRGTSALKLGKFIGKSLLTMTPDVGGLIDCFEMESEKLAETMAQFESDFELLLRKTEIERIVIFIDDLDRCQSEKIVETFETIKLFLDIPECTFVIGADSSKIEHAIKDHYKLDYRAIEPATAGDRSFAEDYIEKIVQIPFRIPEQTLTSIAFYVGMLVLHKELETEAWQRLTGARESITSSPGNVHEGLSGWIRKQNDQAFQKNSSNALGALKRTQPFVSILAHGLRGNPRQIKRFLNILELRQLLAESNGLEVDEGVLVKILVLEYTWRSFFSEVVANCDSDNGRSELLNECRRFRQGEFDVSDSPSLASAIELPGLQGFLAQEPLLDDVDLRPYLFLAQTSLQLPRPALSPPDELAQGLVEAIIQEDRIRSRSAAREASRSDSVIALAVARALIAKLHTESSRIAQVNVVNALGGIGDRHPAMLPDAVRSLMDLDTTKNEAVIVAAVPLLDQAEKQGVDVGSVRDKFKRRSAVAAALDRGTGRSSRPKTRRPG